MSSPRRPNVIVFFTDQQRWDTLGVAGNPMGITPNLDQLATRGTMFTAACASNPLCAPSRAALQTGQYPTEVGVYQNAIALGHEHVTMGAAFKAQGYRTGYIGKWHLSTTNPVPAEDRAGYDVWLGSNTLEFTSDAYRTIVYDNDGQPVELPGYRPDALTDAAIRFIADSGDEPFFLFVSLLEPHQQNELDEYQGPEVYRDTFNDPWTPPDLAALGGSSAGHLPGYYAQVKRLDECVGRIRDVLLSLELTDDTIVSYTSDHGSHFRTRNAEFKRSCHESSIRVPLLIEGPGVPAGHRHNAPVSTVDLAPTLLELADVPRPEKMRQHSLLATNAHDDAVLIQITEAEVGRAIRTSRWKYHVSSDDAAGVGAAPRYMERALYDLRSDPYELDNLIGSANHGPVVDELRATLLRKIREIEGAEPEIDRAPVSAGVRYPETVVRSENLRGVRFGHQ